MTVMNLPINYKTIVKYFDAANTEWLRSDYNTTFIPKIGDNVKLREFSGIVETVECDYYSDLLLLVSVYLRKKYEE